MLYKCYVDFFTMPKNTKGGKGAKSQASKKVKEDRRKVFVYPCEENGLPMQYQHVCIIEKALGNNMYALIDVATSEKRIGSIRKRDNHMRRQCVPGSLIYCHGMEGSDQKVNYITFVYDDEDIMRLKVMRIIPRTYGGDVSSNHQDLSFDEGVFQTTEHQTLRNILEKEEDTSEPVNIDEI